MLALWAGWISRCAPPDAQYEAGDAQGDKDILAEGHEPLHNGLVGAQLSGSQGILLLHDPEEHDAGGHSTQRQDVDGDNVHPLGGPGLDQQGHDQAHDVDEAHGHPALQVELLLQEVDRRLKQVNDGGDAAKRMARKRR